MHTLRVKFLIGMWLFTNRKNSTVSRYLTGNCPDGVVLKNLPATAVDTETGSTPGSGGCLGVVNGNSLKYSYLKNPKEREP